ncbi:MAG TPA: hypothetical protein VN931_02130 [Fibrobacteria bacterium]|nr:hypothetical protein [Fibrobacteria bacterium]
MRIPILATLGMLLMSSCGVQQRIIRAQVDAPSAPPIPILPLDESEHIVIQAGIAQRIGPCPTGGLLNDSGPTPLGLSFDPRTSGGLLGFHYKAIWAGFELSGNQTSCLFGTNTQVDNWKFLGFFGLGATSFHQSLQLQQPVVTSYAIEDRDTVVSLSGSVSSITSTLGLSAMFTSGSIQPFVAFRFLEGPTVDGSSGGAFASTNAFSLSQALLYAGARTDLSQRFHVLAGGGWRTFTGGLIHGSDWNLYLGLGFDLARSPKANTTTSALM